MKNKIILFILLLTACSVFGQVKPAAKKPLNKPGAQTARKAVKKVNTAGFIVSGQVTHTYSYCGGARPTKEIQEELATPKPYSGKKFYIRKGNVNTTTAPVVASFTTDNEGKFSVRLPAGTYSIIVEEQLNTLKAEDLQKENIHVDEKCLKEWWTKPYRLLNVKGNITNLSFSFHHPCFISSDIPCLQFSGPKPQ